jgi:hypothetical protein
MVIGSFVHCQSGVNRPGCNFEQRLNSTVAAAALFIASGWEMASLYVYIIDEVNEQAVLTNSRYISSAIKARLPEVQIVATGNPAWAAALTPGAVDKGGALELVDVFIPRMVGLVNTSMADTARVKAAGKRVGWYTSGNFPDGAYALGTTVEYPAIRPRLMLGMAAQKYGVDAYLYYALNGWAAYSQGVHWSPDAVSETMDVQYMRYTNGTYDGQAQTVVPGPSHSHYSGFLSTLQLVGIRDGIEDLELYKLLRTRLAKATALGIQVDAEAAALLVPDALIAGIAVDEARCQTLTLTQTLRLTLPYL